MNYNKNFHSPAHPDELVNGTAEGHPSWKELYPNLGDKKCEFADSKFIN